MRKYNMYTYYICAYITHIMKTFTHTMVATGVTRAQIWKLFADVNNWHTWDQEIEYARLQGAFEQGNHFTLKPKGGPVVNIKLVEVVHESRFTDCTVFPLAKMYGDHIFTDTPQVVQMTTTMTVKGPLAFLWWHLVAKNICMGIPAEMRKQATVARAY